MSIVNFSDSSLAQLKAVLGAYGDQVIGSLVKTSGAYIESRWFELTEIVSFDEEGVEDEYKAQEVYPDGYTLTDGLRFDSDKENSYKPDEPTYLPNLQLNSTLFSGELELNKAYRVEVSWPTEFGDDPQYFIIPKGGAGGGGITAPSRLLAKEDFPLPKGSVALSRVNLVENDDDIIQENVRVVQFKFPNAQFYSGEPLYGWLVEGETDLYDISATLHGVGS